MSFSHDQALDWLRARGEITRTTRKLAEDWGVSIGSVSSWLSRWEREGLIIREKSPDGMFIRLEQHDAVRLNEERSEGNPALNSLPGVQAEQGSERSAETPIQRSQGRLANAPASPVQQPRKGSVQRSEDDVANAERATAEHLNSVKNQRAKKRSAKPLGRALNALNSDLNAALKKGLPVLMNAESTEHLPAVQRSQDGLANAKASTVQPTAQPVQVNDGDASFSVERDPIAESMNAALGTLATPEGTTPPRMPVPSFGASALAKVTGAVPVTTPEPRLRLHVQPLPREPREWRIGPRIFAIAAATLGGLAAWEAWQITTWYGLQLSSDPDAQQIYARAGQIFVLANVIVPMVCVRLAAEGHLLIAWLGRLFWLSTVAVFCILASTGFSARNLSDTTAVRDAAAKQRAAIEASRTAKRQALVSLPAARAVDVIESELQMAQPRVDRSVWRSTKGCIDVTAERSGEECAAVLELRKEQAISEKRDALMKEIEAADIALAEAPKIADADPQITMAARLLDRLPWIEGSTEGVKDMRIASLVFGIEILPAFLFSAAAALWFGRRRRKRSLFGRETG